MDPKKQTGMLVSRLPLIQPPVKHVPSYGSLVLTDSDYSNTSSNYRPGSLTRDMSCISITEDDLYGRAISNLSETENFSSTSSTSDEFDMIDIPNSTAFVLQWDIRYFAIPLGFFGFTAMWQSVSLYLGISKYFSYIWYALYFISSLILVLSCGIYATRAIIFPQSIGMDFRNQRLLNFFYVPVLIGCLLALTSPPFLRSPLQYLAIFYVFGLYQILLALYTFGEWLCGHFAPEIIHPAVFLQTIGYFMLTTLAASVGLYDYAQFMFSLGVVLWLVVFITNFQHLSTALKSSDEQPQPTFFIFIGPPAQATFASIALQICYDEIKNGLVSGSKIISLANITEWPQLGQSFLYIDLFLYMLMFRLLPTFIKSPFSVAWWAYIFPMSAAASATIWRSHTLQNSYWYTASILLVTLSTAAMTIVLSFTFNSIRLGTFADNEMCLRKYMENISKGYQESNLDSQQIKRCLCNISN